MKVTAVNKATGEVIELPVNSPAEVVQAWQIAQEYDKAATALKDQLKTLVPAIVNERGVSEQIGNYQFRISPIQRYNYDMTVMRRLLPEDDFNALLQPKKKAVDDYLKENLESLGEKSTELRTSMLPDGRPYQVMRLEKVSRDE